MSNSVDAKNYSNANHIKTWFKVGLRLNSHIVQNQACQAAVTLRVMQTTVGRAGLVKITK